MEGYNIISTHFLRKHFSCTLCDILELLKRCTDEMTYLDH